MSSSVKMIKTKINGEWEIILPEHRANRREYHEPPYWEYERLNKMHEVIKPEEKVYYIGAEEGEMPALCQMWGANVLLIEPNEKVLPNIKAIWEANDLLIPDFLVGFAGREATKKPEWGNSKKNWAKITGEVIGDHGFKELHEPGDIPIYKLDDFNEAGYISPRHLILDVEGSEWEVLRGAEKMLRAFKPKIFLSLHPEFMFRIYGEYQYDLRRWIKDFGYKETLLAYEHEVHLFYE